MFIELPVDIKCSNFFISSNFLITSSLEEQKLFIYDKENFRLLSSTKIDNLISTIVEDKKKLYFINVNSEVFEFVSFDKPLKLIDRKLRVHQDENSYSRNRFISYSLDNTASIPKRIGLYEIEPNKLLWEVSIHNRYVYFNEDLLLVDNRENGKWGNICRLSIEDGSILWEINSDFTFLRFLGTHKNLIFLKFDRCCYAVDITTGKIYWKAILCDIYHFQLEKLFYIGPEKYIEINPITGEEHIKIVGEYFKKIKFEPTRNVPRIILNYIITSNFLTKKIGAFNMHNLEFDWIYECQNNNTVYGNEKFVVTDENRVYFLCTDDRLRVFEIENPSDS